MLTGTFVGRMLGHFELLEIVGSGGMAAVLKARDVDLGRIVALKILPPEMAVDTENVNRFKQEARAAARLDHENIARVYNCGEDQGLHFIAFEFIEGENLRQRLEACGGQIPINDAIKLLYQVSRGLAHASERGVVHRDIKPSNIIVTPEGEAKIVDMGLARSLETRASGQLTQSGVTLGTFDYISPEQAIEPRLADVRSDIYSLGCTFYHLLTGHVPVPEGTVAKKLDAHKNLIPPDIRTYNPHVPPELSAIIGRMMAKEPDQRYQHPNVLASELIPLARKMGVILEPRADVTPYGETVKQPWFSFNRVMTVLAVVLLAVLVGLNIYERLHPKNIAIVDNNQQSQNPDQLPQPKQVTPEKVEPEKKDPTPPEKKDITPSGPREASTLPELVSLLKQGAKHIRLTGSEYDFARYVDKDNQPVEGLFQGDDLRIEGTNQPTVRLGYAMPGKPRPKTLTLKGQSTASLTIRGVRFQYPASEGDSELAGLHVTGFSRVTVEACVFSTSFKGGRDGRDGPAELAIDSPGVNVTLTQCYFAPGSVGLRLDSSARLSANECAFAPHHAAIRLNKNEEDPNSSELVFKQCSALLTSGTLIELGEGITCAIQAGHCIFGGMERYGPFSPISTVIRQRGSRQPGTRYEAAKLDETGSLMPNVYHNVAPYAEGEEFYTFAECAKERIPVRDSEKLLLKAPWQDKDPLSLLVGNAADARRAFAPNVKLAALRVPSNPLWEMLGARYIGAIPLYGLPLSPPDPEPRDPSIKVWDPSLPIFPPVAGPLGTYPTLKMALAAMRKGDTLLIRHNGRLEIDPCEFDKPDTDITIKPDANFKPILIPSPATLKRSPAMFKLFGGRLVLDGLHVRLLPERVPSLAVLPGGGQFELRNCLLTFEENEEFSAISLTDPRGEMMMGVGSPATERWPIPKLVLENTVIRGKGRLLNVQGSRPFDADIRNTLAVLDGTLVDITPSAADPSTAGTGSLRLHCLTYSGTGPLVHVRSTEKKNETHLGLAKTEVVASNIVVIPPADVRDAIILAERFDTKDQLERWLSWKGKNNLFSMDKKRTMIEIRPTDLAANPPKLIDAEHWTDVAMEDTDPLVTIRIDGMLPVLGRANNFVAARPIDFRIKSITPKQSDRPTDLGAPIQDLPKPYSEE